MTTPVWLIVCKTPADKTAAKLDAQCPVLDRILIETTLEHYTSTPETFDMAYASAVWSLAFTTVVGLYLVSKNVGLVLALIKGR